MSTSGPARGKRRPCSDDSLQRTPEVSCRSPWPVAGSRPAPARRGNCRSRSPAPARDLRPVDSDPATPRRPGTPPPARRSPQHRRPSATLEHDATRAFEVPVGFPSCRRDIAMEEVIGDGTAKFRSSQADLAVARSGVKISWWPLSTKKFLARRDLHLETVWRAIEPALSPR